jgi:FkbM family methyltransferase
MINRLLPKLLKTHIKRFLDTKSLWVSQAGQDFWVYGECFNFKEEGFFLDIGAHDGIYISNTLLLERKFGWNGICIEANPYSFEQLQQNRKCRTINVALADKKGSALFKLDGVMGGFVGDDFDNRNQSDSNCIEVETIPLSILLQEEKVPEIIDYISVDVEGAEDIVFSGFDLEKHRANVLTIERPSAALREKLTKSGYILVKDIPGLDVFFVHESFKTAYIQNLFHFWDRRLFRFQWTTHK